MTDRRWMVLGIFSLAILGEGCQRVYTLAPVEGTVTKAGQPLVGAQIIFYADISAGTEGPRSWGITDATGHYRLQMDGGGDGAVVGKHRVCIYEFASEKDLLNRLNYARDASSKPGQANTAPKVIEPKVPPSYGQIHETPLRAAVHPGGVQCFDFNIP